jgi:hypothetical protein
MRTGTFRSHNEHAGADGEEQILLWTDKDSNLQRGSTHALSWLQGCVRRGRISEWWMWDHAIELEEGFKLTRGPMYSLNRKQEEEMNKFVDENLRSGQIRPSKSPQSPPFFFV